MSGKQWTNTEDDFMRKHYTSKRIVDLIAILKNYNIQY